MVRRFTLLVAVALGVLLLFTVLNSITLERIAFSQDQALTLVIAEAGLRGEVPLIGSPSHRYARHLGPSYNWYLMLLWSMSGYSLPLLVKLDAVMKLFGVAVMALLAYLLLPRGGRLFGVCGVFAVALSGHYVELFRQQWQNFSLFIPLTVTYLTFFLLMTRGGGALPWFLVAASVAVQTHFLTIPLVALFIFCAALAVVSSAYHGQWALSSLISRSTFLGWILLILVWTGPALFELLYPSNIGGVARGLLTPKTGSGFGPALATLESFVALYAFGQTNLGAVRYFTLTPMVPLLVSGVLLLTFAFGILGSRERGFLFAALLTIPLYVLAVARQEPPLHPYYYSALLPLPLLLGGVILGSIPELYRSVRASRQSAARIVFLSGLTLCTLVYGAYSFKLWRGSWSENVRRGAQQTIPASASARHVTEMGAVLRDLIGDEQHELLLDIRGSNQAMRDAYFFALGPSFHSRIRYCEHLVEQPSVVRCEPEQSDRGVARLHIVLVCPRVARQHRQRFQASLHAQAVSWEAVALDDVFGGRDCEMYWSRYVPALSPASS